MMTTTRITQRLMAQHSLSSMQTNLNRLSNSQDRLSSGKAINRPSDSPTGTNDAMRLRSALAAGEQHSANAADATSWLDHADSTLSSMMSSVHRVRDLVVQGANTGANGTIAREALATELTQIRSSMLADANTKHLGRPIFGGTTSGTTAYDPSGTYVGDTNSVDRTIGDGVNVSVNVVGPDAFSTPDDDLFKVLGDAITQLRSNPAELSGTINRVDAMSLKMTSALADIGSRQARVDATSNSLSMSALNNKTSLSDVEGIDLAAAIMDVQLQTTAYQAALGATAKVIQPSLLDFLR
jgi:flagellar hook-associated protein 3 FlgL